MSTKVFITNVHKWFDQYFFVCDGCGAEEKSNDWYVKSGAFPLTWSCEVIKRNGKHYCPECSKARDLKAGKTTFTGYSIGTQGND